MRNQIKMKQKCTLFLLIFLLASCRSQTAALPVPNIPVQPSPTLSPEIWPSATPSLEQGKQVFQGDKVFMFDENNGWLWAYSETLGYHLFHTRNGAQTWQDVTPQGFFFNPGTAYFLDAETAWLGTVTNPSVPDTILIAHTIDGGQNWQNTTFGVDYMQAGMFSGLQFCDLNKGYAILSNVAAGSVYSQIHYTEDSGVLWRHILPNNPEGNEANIPSGTIRTNSGDSLVFRCNGEMWVGGGFGFPLTYAPLTISRDFGKTWNETKLALPDIEGLGKSSVYVREPFFVSEIAYLPVIVGTKLVVFVSQDDGFNWVVHPNTGIELGDSALYFSGLDFVTPLDGFVRCGNDFCVTHDGAKTWQVIAPNIPLSQIEKNGETSNLMISFDFVTPHIGFAIVYQTPEGQTLLYKTMDDGNTWKPLDFQITN